MDTPRKTLSGPAKLIVILIVPFLLALGLCRVQIVLLNDTSINLGYTLPGIFFVLGYVEVFVMLVCILGIAITLAYWAFRSIFRRRN